LIRDFYAARARRDLVAVRDAIAPDVVWHEAGSRPPYTGDLVGREAVLAMMVKAAELTDGTFRLDLDDVLANDRHTVALVSWVAERGERALRGKEIAVYRIREGRLAEAWFYADDLRTVEAFWA
jgi:ketosteroid isomerase-like protein